MSDDSLTVDVPIPVDAAVAPALEHSITRAIAGRLVSRMLQPASVERLLEVMDAIAAEAERRGLTDEILESELAAYNAERQGAPPPPSLARYTHITTGRILGPTTPPP